jgi:hypothetical protein
MHRYMVEFRNSSEGQAFATNDKKRSLALGALAGQRWNVMTEAQKAVSFRTVCDASYDGSC